LALLMSMLPIIYNVIKLGKVLFMQDRATRRGTTVVSRITTAAMLKRHGEVVQIRNHTRGRLESSRRRGISYGCGTDDQWEGLAWAPQTV
jgi:hypothetical protein